MTTVVTLAAAGACAVLATAGGPARALTPQPSVEREVTLRYGQPAARWTEALPLGNGRVGAMVFGGTHEERVQINESTLWGGGPHDYPNPEAGAHLDAIRQLIFAGKVEEATQRSERVMGRPKLLMPYQPFCDLRLRFPGHTQVAGYHRELDLESATARTVYAVGATEFRREAFVSYPDQVLVVRLTASQPGQLTFTVAMDSPQPDTRVEAVGDDGLQLTGQIQPRQNPPSSWIGSWDRPGMRFAAVLRVIPEGGTMRRAGGRLDISTADAATIVFSNATSFRSYRDIGGDAVGTAFGHLERAGGRSYDELRQRHVEDFGRLFSRVQLRLGETPSTEPTDRRISGFAGNEDPGLIALYFHFGRYVLISSSRPGGQPANLQGIWNDQLRPPWGSKWTTNINLQMNYWLADTGGLWEAQEPLWSLIRDLRVTGAETARAHYDARGWVLHHNTDLWRATTPVDGAWGVWPMGSVWLANQMWDHYEFSQDREFLRREAYPAMKGAAEFALDLLVPAPPGTPVAGQLVTNPSTSPENTYRLQGKSHHLTYAPAMDIQLLRELFEHCRRAAGILGTDAEFRLALERAGRRLPRLRVGARGQLQEWIEDYVEAEPTHRHVSHLYALYPGRGIRLDSTPALAAAARKTLELRGEGGTGWALAWQAALWARLEDGERAYASVKRLITTSTLPNMFDLHPPFQIDGNLGGPAAITEMLIQSTADEVRVLPALPREWSTGSLKGVRVRGGAAVDLAWRDGRLTELTLRGDRAGEYRVRYGERSVDVRLAPGVPIALDSALRRVGR